MDTLLFEVDRVNLSHAKIRMTRDRAEDTRRREHKNMTNVMFLEKLEEKAPGD